MPVEVFDNDDVIFFVIVIVVLFVVIVIVVLFVVEVVVVIFLVIVVVVVEDHGQRLTKSGVKRIVVPLECLRYRVEGVVDRRILGAPAGNDGLEVCFESCCQVSKGITRLGAHRHDVTP